MLAALQFYAAAPHRQDSAIHTSVNDVSATDNSLNFFEQLLIYVIGCSSSVNGKGLFSKEHGSQPTNMKQTAHTST